MRDQGNIFNSTITKVFSLLLVAIFLFISNAPYYHHHHSNSTVEFPVYKKVLKKSDHCKICDHFLHHKRIAVLPALEFNFHFTLPVEKVVTGIHLIGDPSSIVYCFSNKGPPAQG